MKKKTREWNLKTIPSDFMTSWSSSWMMQLVSNHRGTPIGRNVHSKTKMHSHSFNFLRSIKVISRHVETDELPIKKDQSCATDVLKSVGVIFQFCIFNIKIKPIWMHLITLPDSNRSQYKVWTFKWKRIGQMVETYLSNDRKRTLQRNYECIWFFQVRTFGRTFISSIAKC